MKVCCDYCRGRFGLMVHRHWHMRFCSAACVQGYERGLDQIKARMRRRNSRSGGEVAVIEGLAD